MVKIGVIETTKPSFLIEGKNLDKYLLILLSVIKFQEIQHLEKL